MGEDGRWYGEAERSNLVRGDPGSSRGEEKRPRERRAALAMVVAETVRVGAAIAGAGSSSGGMTPKSIALTGVPSTGDMAFPVAFDFDFPFSGRAPNSLGSIANRFYPINRLRTVVLASCALQWSDLHKASQ